MRRQLLFVTAVNEDFDEGFSYAVDLARAMNEDITILFVHKKTLLKKFDDVMAAVTFAEAGEHGTAREMLTEKSIGANGKLEILLEKCRAAGINADVRTVALDTVSAVKDFLKQKNSIDMVLLSPSITTSDVTSKELNRLVKTASRPIVTMSRQALLPAHQPY